MACGLSGCREGGTMLLRFLKEKRMSAPIERALEVRRCVLGMLRMW